MFVCNRCSLSLSAIWNILWVWRHHSDGTYHVFMSMYMYMYATTVLYGIKAWKEKETVNCRTSS